MAESGSKASADYSSFEWEAMNTHFEIRIAQADPAYAYQASQAAFQELDRLEKEFSRFLEGSPVSRINRAPAGQAVRISHDVLYCLEISRVLAQLTEGVFRTTWQSPVEADLFPLDLNREALTVTKLHDGAKVDLGGIGKGYGLDCMREVLNDWDLQHSLLIGGGSSLLALAGPTESKVDGWPVSLSFGDKVYHMELIHGSVSSSGVEERGDHIFDPALQSGAKDKKRSWAFATNAVESDALSTAFFLMESEKIEKICKAHPFLKGVRARRELETPEWEFFGNLTFKE